MTKAVPAILALALACLFTLSSALPSVLTQTVSTQTEPNAPRTLLGKPYRRCSDSQGCPPPRCILSVTVRNDSAANAAIDPETLTDADRASPHQALAGNDDSSQTIMNTVPCVPLPLPLVLDTMNIPESVQARLRLIRLKRPLRYGRCSDDAPLINQVRSNGVVPRDGDELHVQPPIASRPAGKIGPREATVPVRRSKRLYDKGEWKSRLFEEY